jgi:4-alpha-glucanotransferase
MTDEELIRRAEALGVSVSYLDWRKRRVDVAPDVLRAIVGVLDGVGAGPGLAGPSGAAAGAGDAHSAPGAWGAGGSAVPADPAAAAGYGDAKPVMPAGRSWGFTVQLYSVRSRRSWGHGDLRDLADLARWSARQLGADFILINPLHAVEPLPPLTDSPYLPMTRRYLSPIYLRVEDIEEFAQLSGVQRQAVEELAQPQRAASITPDLIDRNAVWDAKRRALELIHPLVRSDEREASYRAYVEREGPELVAWSRWCALAELHGPDWREWPPGLASPALAERLASAGPVAERAEFHAWLQWLLDGQLAAAQRAALAAGMKIGVIADLAVGVAPGGADAWAHQDVLVQGMSVGAPPDGFNQLGQYWSQPPWHPQHLAAAGARPLADLLGATLRHAGGIRVDHVMSLMRLWWVPDGMTPDHGAYVRYDHRLTVGALTTQAARAGALAIGEDLGTVDEWIRHYLADRQILGTEMLWFAREPDGSRLLAPRWRRACMATVGSHDLPPVSGFVTGDQVTVRARLGLLKDPEAERKSAELALSGWCDVMADEGLLPSGRDASPDEFTVALYRYLTLTPSLLIGVSLADAVGDRRTQNIPGTWKEYPNWRVPLCDSEGTAVLLDDLLDLGQVRKVARAVADGLRV